MIEDLHHLFAFALEAWVAAVICGAAGIALLVYWRRVAKWTAWWILSPSLLWLSVMYWFTQFGMFGFSIADNRAYYLRGGATVLALSIFAATILSWVRWAKRKP